MEFTGEQWHGLKQHAEEKGLIFLSSPFSLAAVQLLEGLGIAAWKIASGEVTNALLLDAMLATGKPPSRFVRNEYLERVGRHGRPRAGSRDCPVSFAVHHVVSDTAGRNRVESSGGNGGALSGACRPFRSFGHDLSGPGGGDAWCASGGGSCDPEPFHVRPGRFVVRDAGGIGAVVHGRAAHSSRLDPPDGQGSFRGGAKPNGNAPSPKAWSRLAIFPRGTSCKRRTSPRGSRASGFPPPLGKP